MATTTPAWETIKENSAPLERGRNVYALEQFVMETDEERDSKQRMVQTFELRVAPEKSSTFEDPLVDWLSYIKFHQDAYPAATHDQFLLLERCFRTFHKNKRYFNDVRFIRVCCLYADKTAEPCATFKELYKLGIGHASATFWNAWAFVAEKQEDFKLAEQIFEKGLRKQAEPIDYLKLRQKRFQRRMGRYWLNSMRQNDDEEDVRRSVLGSLSSASTVHRHSGRGGAAGRTFQTGAASLSTFVDRSASNNGSTVKAPFPIFSDSENTLCSNFLEDSSDIPTDREREVEAERWKENCATAERWNERGALISNTYNCPLSSIARSTTAHSAFAIHVDEECAVHHVREEHERQLHAASQRRARDERTAVFREHEASVAETLSLDPLRYVRHPEQADQDSKRRRAPESSQKMVMRFVGKQRLLTDNGVEQCFEEARASTGFYTLLTASSNFNYFVKQQENFNDSFASVYSAEFASDDEKTFGSSAAKDETKLLKRKAFATREQREAAKLRHITGKPPTLSCRKPPVAVSTSLHMHNNTSFESVIPTPRNVSTVSSTIDEAVAVGVPTGKEEQTINTQVALKELSMMFSSPALDLNGGTGIRTGSFGSILNKSASSDLGNTSAVMDGIVENVESDTSSDPNSSFAAQDDDNENDRAVRNPDARSNKTSGFEQMALRKLSQESKGQEGRDLECVAHRRIGRISQDDRFRALAENDLPTNPGFSIYNEDDEEGKEPEPSGFPIFKNADYGGYESLQPRVASAFQKDRNVFTTSVCRQSHRAKDLALSLHRASDDTNEGSVASHRKPAFQIFRDDDDKGVRSQVGNWKFSSTSGVLQISADVSDEVCENYHFHDGGTATIVVAGEVIQDSDKATKVLQQANPLEGIGVRELSQEFRNRNHAHKNRDDGVTATFSLIGELNHALEDNITESATRTASTSDRLALFHSYEKGGRAVSPTFLGGNEGRASDYSRDETTETVTSSGRFQIDADVLKLDSPKFGDISHIAPSEDTTMTIRFPQGGAIDYLSLHHRNMTDSVNRVKLNASGSLPDAKSLSNALSSRLMNYDLPTHVLPRPLKRGTFQPGTQLTLGCSTATVDRELGRGAYGVVVLLKDAGQFNTGAIAVKSQSPIGCLAWEYEILKKVEDRVRKSSQQVAGRLPFPSALSFVSVADGAMLAMSAGSRSGLNIVDLVNVYAKLGEQVPEIVALHYTARMLHHLGVLHWHAKVMHCDTKPDNWVLLSVESDTDASDLMLVDFGRAVDLESANNDGTSLMDTLFIGPATTEDMMCVSMRQNLPWSFDLDTFGVCASAHVLLFGAHMKIGRNKAKRWMPVQKFPRQFEQKLWMEIFDTLLNLDECFGRAIGSLPISVKRLRMQIEEHLRQEEARLQTALYRQASLLP